MPKPNDVGRAAVAAEAALPATQVGSRRAVRPASGVRVFLSLKRAQLRNLLGQGGGFFIQYDHVASVARDPLPYPEIFDLCEASPWAEHLQRMASHAAEFRQFGDKPLDPVWINRMFDPLDGAAAFAAVRHFKPQRIIEVGSGNSTFFMSRAAGPETKILCIDPAPRRAISELPLTLHQRVLTADDANLVGELEAGDILFIDSSHILLPGTDVDILFNRCFPRLKPGVIVHIHDIFLPNPYPAAWEHRNWNEQSALHGWLVSGFFDIVYPGHHVVAHHPDQIDAAFEGFPPCLYKHAGSLWLRRS